MNETMRRMADNTLSTLYLAFAQGRLWWLFKRRYAWRRSALGCPRQRG